MSIYYTCRCSVVRSLEMTHNSHPLKFSCFSFNEHVVVCLTAPSVQSCTQCTVDSKLGYGIDVRFTMYDLRVLCDPPGWFGTENGLLHLSVFFSHSSLDIFLDVEVLIVVMLTLVSYSHAQSSL